MDPIKYDDNYFENKLHNYEIVPDKYFVCYFIANMGAGKTYNLIQIINLISSYYDKVFIFAPTNDPKIEKNLKERFKESNYHYYTNPEEMVEEIKKYKEKKKIVIIDDGLKNKYLFDFRGNSEFCQMISGIRHNHMSVFLIAQGLRYLPASVRELISVIMTTRFKNKAVKDLCKDITDFDIEKIFNFMASIKYKQFKFLILNIEKNIAIGKIKNKTFKIY